jgi:hypothetical protein
MSMHPEGGGRPALLWGTIKATAAIAGLAIVTTAWLSSETLDRRGLARLTGVVVAASGSMGDPVTTGSLAGGAIGVKLDPCARPQRP